MSSVIEGQVEFIKQNDAGYYAVKMSDGQWYGCNKEKPGFDKGDKIRFEVVTNGRYLNVDMPSVEKLGAGTAPARKAPPARSAGGAPRSFAAAGKDDYWKAKEARDIAYYAKRDIRDERVQNEIRLQASRNAAIALMGVVMSNGLLVLKEEKKKGHNIEILATYVDKLTQKYYEATQAINAAAPNMDAEDLEPEKAHENETQAHQGDFEDDIPF